MEFIEITDEEALNLPADQLMAIAICVKKYGNLVHSLLPISQELHSANAHCCFS